MKKTLTLLSILALTFTFAQAEMKCAAGKCGSAMGKKAQKEPVAKPTECGEMGKKIKCKSGKCASDINKTMTDKAAKIKDKCNKGKCGGQPSS